MQTKHLCVLIHISPIHVISGVCLLYFRVRLLIVALWSPARKGLTSWLSFVMSYCAGYFPIGILGQVWNLIVSIPVFALFCTFSMNIHSSFFK